MQKSMNITCFEEPYQLFRFVVDINKESLINLDCKYQSPGLGQNDSLGVGHVHRCFFCIWIDYMTSFYQCLMNLTCFYLRWGDFDGRS